MWSNCRTALKLMTLVIEEIEGGSARWQGRGGQSHGWDLMHWLQERYDVPDPILMDVVSGYTRWQ